MPVPYLKCLFTKPKCKLHGSWGKENCTDTNHLLWKWNDVGGLDNTPAPQTEDLSWSGNHLQLYISSQKLPKCACRHFNLQSSTTKLETRVKVYTGSGRNKWRFCKTVEWNRWRGEFVLERSSSETRSISVAMECWSAEHRAFTVEVYLKNNDSVLTQRIFRRHFHIHRNECP